MGILDYIRVLSYIDHSNIFSGVLLTILGTLLIPKYIDWRNRPNVKIFFKVSNKYQENLSLEFGQIKDGFDLSIKNYGLKTYREVYWNLSVSNKVKIVFKPDKDNHVPQRRPLPNSDFDIISGLIREPLYPGRICAFSPAIISWQFPMEINEYQFYYYFSTEYGLSPKKAEIINLINRNLSPEDTFNYMDKVTIRLLITPGATSKVKP